MVKMGSNFEMVQNGLVQKSEDVQIRKEKYRKNPEGFFSEPFRTLQNILNKEMYSK